MPHYRAAEHADEVEGVDTEVEQRAAAEVGTHDALFVAHRVSEGGGDEAGLAYAPVGNELAHDAHNGLIARPYRLGNEHTTLVGKIQDLLRLPCIGHKGLLHEAGLAGFYRRLRHIVVVRVRRADVDEVDVGVSDEFGIRAVGAGDAPLRGESLRRIQSTRSHGESLARCCRCVALARPLGKSVKGNGRLLGNPSRSNDSYSHINRTSRHHQIGGGAAARARPCGSRGR